MNFNGGADQISSLASSQIDIGNADAGAGLLNAISRDLPMKFVADGGQCSQDHCPAALIVRKQLIDSGAVKQPSDLKGKNVNMATPGSTLNQYMNRVLDLGGLTPADVNQQHMALPDQVAAFANSALDAAWEIEPLTTQMVAKGTVVRWHDMYDLFGPQQDTVLIYSPNFAAQRQEVGRKFKYTALKDPATYKQMPWPSMDPTVACS